MSRRVVEWVLEVKGNAAAETERIADGIEHVRSASKDTERALDDIKRGSEKVFGGVVGDVEDVGRGLMALGSSAGPAAAAFGTIGIASAAVAAGAVAAAQALFEFIDGADAAIERLKEIEGAKPIPASTIAALKEWEQGALNAEAAGQRLYAVTAGELAAAFSEMPDFFADAFDALTVVVQEMGNLREVAFTLEPALRVMMGVLSLGVTEWARWALASDEATDATERNTKAVDEMAEAHRNAQAAADAYMGSWDSMMLSLTGASDAEIKHLQAMEAIDRQTAELIEAKRADGTLTDELNTAIIEGSELMKAQAAAALEAQKAKLAQAEAAKAAAAATREEAAAAAQAARDMKELIAALDEGIAMREAFAKHLEAKIDAALPTDGLAEALAAIDAPTNADIDAAMAEVEATLTAEIQQGRADTMSGIADGLGAVSGGLGGLLTALGPAGAIAGTIVEMLPQLSGMIEGIMDEAFTLVRDLPGILETLLSETLPEVLADLPDLASEIVESLDDIVIAIVQAAPELILAVFTLPYRIAIEFFKGLPDLVKGIAEGFLEAFKSLWESVKEFFSTLLKGDKTKTTGTNLADGRFFGADISPNDEGWFGALKSFDVGGVITKTGLAQVHAGEMIGSPSQMSQVLGRSASAGSTTVNVGTIIGNSEEAVRQITEIMRRQQGAYGLGTSLDPMGG